MYKFLKINILLCLLIGLVSSSQMLFNGYLDGRTVNIIGSDTSLTVLNLNNIIIEGRDFYLEIDKPVKELIVECYDVGDGKCDLGEFASFVKKCEGNIRLIKKDPETFKKFKKEIDNKSEFVMNNIGRFQSSSYLNYGLDNFDAKQFNGLMSDFQNLFRRIYF